MENSIGDANTIKGDNAIPLGCIDQYELVRELGGGGFGTVFLARDTISGVDVSVRILPPGGAGHEDLSSKFRRWFSRTSRIHHPGIASPVTLHRIENARLTTPSLMDMAKPGAAMVVSACPTGISLAKLRHRFQGRVLPLPIVLKIARQLASALDYAHSVEVRHDCLRPDNVMVDGVDDDALSVQMVDYGLEAVYIRELSESTITSVDATYTFPVNRSYFSPEEWQGKFRNGASDQYALAAIVYELLVGNIPFASAFAMGDILVAANAVMSVSPEIPDELPESVRSALAKALAKRPEERFASCADFVAALEGNVKVESVRRVVPDAQGGGTRASRPVVIIALLALLGAGGGVWYWQDVKTRDLRRIVSEQKTALELKASEVRSLEKRVEEERIAREGAWRKLSEQLATIKETEEKLKQIKAEKKELDCLLGEARRKADEALEKERDRLVKKFAEQESSLTNRLMQLHADECSRLEAKSKSALERAQKAESALSELRAANAATGSGSYAAGGEASGPKHGDAKTLILPGGVTMEMIYCAPGEYVYGEDEKPSRIEQGFWLGKYEVTQRQWASVMGENGSYFKGEDLPVDTISWDDCQRFVAKINARLSCGARLPTEHEWEYACRAATKTEYSWGDALNGDKANCDGTYPVGTEEKGAYLKKTVSVDSYAPNPWGFHCMHGNVREWCHDVFDSSRRVLRGGSWYHSPAKCRSASRDGSDPSSRYSNFGFRLCCSEMEDAKK